MHFDLTSSSAEDQRRTVDLALQLGARPFDVGQRGDEGHVVLADPEGNEFCVIGPDNAFLAGTARIGALAGEGMPEVGFFWSRVLGWPLVWDQDGETAIQSRYLIDQPQRGVAGRRSRYDLLPLSIMIWGVLSPGSEGTWTADRDLVDPHVCT